MTKILDQHGNPIDLGAIREAQTERATGQSTADLAHIASLVREWDNHPGRALTPARLESILRQAEQGDLIALLELADDIEERDGHVFAQMATRKTAVVTLDWDVEPPEDASAAEQAQADQVRDWIRALPEFEDGVLLPLLDGILKGFSAVEMWWEPDQRTLQPRFAARPQRWLCLDEDRQTLRLRNGSSQHGVPLQPYGWLLHQHRARNGYLARASLARVLAWPFLFKHYAVRDLAEFLEIYGLPIRLGKYPAGSSDEEKRKLLQAVVSIGHNAGGVIPQSMAVDLLNAADGTEGPFKTMWDGMDAVQSKIILGQTLTSGEGTHGTQALGTVHNEVRIDLLKADAKRLAATLTSQLVAPMALLNIPGADPRRLPRFVIDVPEPEDLALYADALPKLASAGMRIGIKDLHRRLRIEEAEDGEEILRGTAAPAAPAAPGAAGAEPDDDRGDEQEDDREDDQAPAKTPATEAPRAKGAGKTALAGELPAAQPQRDAIDDLVDAATAEWRPLMRPLVQPLLAELQAALDAGLSLEQFRDRLPDLVARMDGTAAAEDLARAAFVARLAGEADLDLTGDETA